MLDQAKADEMIKHDMSRRIRKLIDEHGAEESKRSKRDNCKCPASRGQMEFIPLVPAIAALAIGLGKRRPVRG